MKNSSKTNIILLGVIIILIVISGILWNREAYFEKYIAQLNDLDNQVEQSLFPAFLNSGSIAAHRTFEYKGNLYSFWLKSSKECEEKISLSLFDLSSEENGVLYVIEGFTFGFVEPSNENSPWETWEFVTQQGYKQFQLSTEQATTEYGNDQIAQISHSFIFDDPTKNLYLVRSIPKNRPAVPCTFEPQLLKSSVI